MKRGNKICPFCGRNIRETDKFCPFCGKKVLDVGRSVVEQQPQPPIGQTQQQPGPQPPAPKQSNQIQTVSQPVGPQTTQKIEEEKIPDEILAQLEYRAKIKNIENELSDIRDKIDQLALKLTSEDPEGIEEEIKRLSNMINELKSEKKELETKLVSLPFEELKNKRKDLDSKIARLQNAFSLGEISENAYNKLREEYEQNLRELNKQAEQQKVKLSIWIRNLRLKRDELIEELDLLKARQIAGEFSEDEYIKRKKATQNKIEKLEYNIDLLNSYL
ncbi:MAG: zinc-ribbon domain-containing protein [Candidatus Helarchaeota archaeon]